MSPGTICWNWPVLQILHDPISWRVKFPADFRFSNNLVDRFDTKTFWYPGVNEWGLNHLKELTAGKTVFAAQSIQGLREKIKAGGAEIEEFKELYQTDFKNLDKEMVKRVQRISDRSDD